MNTQNTNAEKAQANSTQQITSKDVLLTQGLGVVPDVLASWCVMPMDERPMEFYFNPIVAKIAADSMAKASGGKVIRK